MVQCLLANCKRCFDGKTVSIIDRVCGEHTVDVIHSRNHRCEVRNVCIFIVFFARTSREKKCRILKYLIVTTSPGH